MSDLKEVNKCAGLVFHYNYSGDIEFEKDKSSKEYIIRVKDKIFKFKTYKDAVRTKVIESPYGKLISLQDVNKILKYYGKIKEIELQGLEQGKDIFIDDFDENDEE